MISAVSGSASLEPHLHLDPALTAKTKFRDGKVWCCFFNCCNKQEDTRHKVIYCDKNGCCKEFNHEYADIYEERLRKTSVRIAHLVGEVKPLGEVFADTGIDLLDKAHRGAPITIKEIKQIQGALSDSK